MDNQNNQNLNPTSLVSPVAQTPPVSSPINPPDGGSKSKLPIIIIGIILFLLLAGSAAGFYVFKQQSVKTARPTTVPIVQKVNPTANPDLIGANWKTYNGVGYTFKYPENALITTQTKLNIVTGQKVNSIIVKPPYQAPYDKYFEFEVYLEENKQNLDAKQIVENYIAKSANTGPEGKSASSKVNSTLKHYTNNSIDGWYAKYGWDYDFVNVVMVKNNKTYTFYIAGDQGTVNNYSLQIFDQILSTFKFTSPVQASVSADINSLISYTVPSGWRLSTQDKIIYIASPDFPKEIPSGTFPTSGCNIIIGAYSTDFPSIEMYHTERQGGGGPGPQEQNLRKTTVAGVEALQSDTTSEFTQTDTTFIKAGYVYGVEYSCPVGVSGEGYGKYLNIYNQFLSTIKFNN